MYYYYGWLATRVQFETLLFGLGQRLSMRGVLGLWSRGFGVPYYGSGFDRCQPPPPTAGFPRAAREKRAEVGGDEASAGWGLWAQGLQATWHDHQILKSRENHRSPSNHRQPTSKPRKVECRTRGRGQSIRDCQSACLQRSQRKGHKCKQEKYERGRGEGLGFRGGFKQSRALDWHSYSGGGVGSGGNHA